MNEIRNELLTILNLQKNGEEEREFYTALLLERFKYDIKAQLEEVNRKKKELEDNLETLNMVKKELNIKENMYGAF